MYSGGAGAARLLQPERPVGQIPGELLWRSPVGHQLDQVLLQYYCSTIYTTTALVLELLWRRDVGHQLDHVLLE